MGCAPTGLAVYASSHYHRFGDQTICVTFTELAARIAPGLFMAVLSLCVLSKWVVFLCSTKNNNVVMELIRETLT